MALIECHGLRKDYAGNLVLEGVELAVQPGEKLGLVGANGAGKTTLLRHLVGEDEDYKGSIVRDPGLRLGYFTRHMEPAEEGSALDYLLEVARLMKAYEGAFERHESLGGERASRALVFVEPAGRESVEERLAEYEGTILVVSHDRYFLDKVAERVVYAHEGKFLAFEGDFSEFWAEEGASLRPGAVKEGREGAAIEGRIVELEAAKSSLETRIKKAFDRREFKEARGLANELEELLREIERLYARSA